MVLEQYIPDIEANPAAASQNIIRIKNTRE